MIITDYPRGSKSPIFKDPGPKYHSEYGFWNTRSLKILGTWTRWVQNSEGADKRGPDLYLGG